MQGKLPNVRIRAVPFDSYKILVPSAFCLDIDTVKHKSGGCVDKYFCFVEIYKIEASSGCI